LFQKLHVAAAGASGKKKIVAESSPSTTLAANRRAGHLLPGRTARLDRHSPGPGQRRLAGLHPKL